MTMSRSGLNDSVGGTRVTKFRLLDAESDLAFHVTARGAAIFLLLVGAAALGCRFLDSNQAAEAALKVVTATFAVGIVPGALLTLLWRPRPQLSVMELVGFGIAVSLVDVEPGRVVRVDESGVRISTSDGDVMVITAEVDGRLVSRGEISGLFGETGMAQSERVRIVPLERRHLSQTCDWANDPEIVRLMNHVRPVSSTEHETWFVSIVGSEECAYFAIETVDAGVHVGNVWLWAIDHRHQKAELRVVIGDEAVRGQGLGSDAIDQLCRHAFDCLGLHRVYAYVRVINPAAQRAFERAGFVPDGTLRDDQWAGEGFIDTYLMSRLHV